MRRFPLVLLGFIASGMAALPVTAQQEDNTLTLPDAQPGECYAKVITPPQFETMTEEVVVQEASERIETIEAQYNTVDQNLIIKEASQELIASDAVFETETETIEVSAAEQSWTSTMGEQTIPASPDALEQIALSGVDINSAPADSCFSEYYIEAKYEERTQRVLVKEASEKITIVPAEFETVREQIEIKQASTEVVDVPAVYRTETESVLVEPARNVWSHCGLVERSDNTAGEIMCLNRQPERYETLTKTVLDTPATTKTINIPAVYQSVEVQRLVKPASEVREEIPAEYDTITRRVRVEEPTFFWLAKDAAPDSDAIPTGRTVCRTVKPAEYASIEKQVVAEPAKTTATPVPAVYETIAVEQLVAPASERRIVIPERTRTVTSRTEIAPGRLEWRQVLCGPDITTETVVSIQRALRREGFNPGRIDGIIGRETLNAMEQYQAENSLGRGGITYEALEKLEIKTAES